MIRKLSLLALLSCGAPLAAGATEPTAPIAFDDTARLMELELVLTDGLTARDVAVVQVFNRFQGRVVDVGARLAGGFPVRRALEVRDVGGGRVRISLEPVPAGQRLPDGLYSQLLEIESLPVDLAREPFTLVHPVYFEVAGGVPRRLDMPTYSDRVEPAGQGLDKLRQPIALHPGLPAASATLRRGAVVEAQIERGDAFALPGDERGEN